MKLQEFAAEFNRFKVLVAGDVILDEYLVGTATRISREAPIPVLELTERRYIAGGAANPAANIAALGAEVIQLSAIGDDTAGHQLRAALAAVNVNSSGLITAARITPVKTRVMAQMGLRFPQQVARIDSLPSPTVSADDRAQLSQRLHGLAVTADALLFSDYRGGILNAEWVQSVRSAFPQHLMTADTQGNLPFYRGFDMVKCNAEELQQAIGRQPQDEADYALALATLSQELALGAIVVTRGAEGASLYSEGQYVRVAAPSIRDVFDTVGAGDTFIAVATLARLAGAGWQDAVQLANIASGIVIQHVGNYAPTMAELLQAVP